MSGQKKNASRCRPGTRIAWLGGTNKFWVGTRSWFMWIREGLLRPKTGNLLKKKVFTEILRDFPAEIKNSNGFSVQKQMISKTKRSSSQKCHQIRCQSTNITKIPVVNTNLGLDLHSSIPEPVNFFGAQSLLGGAQFSFGGAQAVIPGGTAPECPPLAPGLSRLPSESAKRNFASFVLINNDVF